jgi:fucose permease
MIIISGAIVRLLMGFLADSFGVQLSYTIPLACFLTVWLAIHYGKE